MFTIDTAAKAKKSARALEKALAKRGIDLLRGHALNVLAAIAGFKDWNGLQSSLCRARLAQPISPQIWEVDFDKVQIVRVFGSDYVIEPLDSFDEAKEWLCEWENGDNPFQGRNPFILRLVSQNEESYGHQSLRAKELLSFIWNQEQQCFVSLEYGRMHFYQLVPYQFVPAVAEAGPSLVMAHGLAKDSSTFSILDVDFSRVTALSKGGEGFWVDAEHYSEALAWLDDWSNPENGYDPDVPVLELTHLDDHGFPAHTQLYADELLALKWSAPKGLFLSPEGVEYRFEYQNSVSPGSAEG